MKKDEVKYEIIQESVSLPVVIYAGYLPVCG
jgi:hypothetical protein